MRGQLDTAIGMILTLTIVAAVLGLAMWGFFQLSRMTSDAAYVSVYDSLERAGADHASFGSRHILRIAPPEPFCVFNTSVAVADRVCAPGYSGHAICESSDLESYWGNASDDDGNVVFRSGRNERIDFIAPHNGAYACFDQGSQVIFMEGKGRYATVSPMREIRSIALHEYDGGSCDLSPSARFRLFTTSPTGSVVELAGFEGTGNIYCTPTRTTLMFSDGVEYEIADTNDKTFVININANNEIDSLTMVLADTTNSQPISDEYLVLLP
jgi:hypothetical protein